MAVVTLNCIADTYTVRFYPDANYNDREYVLVTGGDSGPPHYAYYTTFGWLRFNASSLPEGFSWSDVSTATLRLFLRR